VKQHGQYLWLKAGRNELKGLRPEAEILKKKSMECRREDAVPFSFGILRRTWKKGDWDDAV